jgi:hypothetical protein
MSASQYKAAFQLPNNIVFYFSTLRSEEGGPTDEPELLFEELAPPGIDGSRHRDLHLQFSKWVFTTSADAGTLDAVDGLYASYMRAQQQALVGTLRLDRGGFFKSYRHLKILNVTVRRRAGTSIGFGAESFSNALIYATWITQFVSDPAL